MSDADDPTERIDATTPLPAPDPTGRTADDSDRTDQARALRFLTRRLVVWGLPLIAIGVLLTTLGLPAWIILVTLALSLAIAVFEIDL